MIENNFTDWEMELRLIVSIDGPNSPYVVTWTGTILGDTLSVVYSSSPPLVGGIGETITVTLVDVKAFTSQDNIPIPTPIKFEYTLAELPPSETTESGSTGASYTFIATMATSLGISLLTGGSMELMWSLANTLQIIFFYSLLRLYFTPDLISVYKFMAYSNFDNPATKYASKIAVGGIGFINSPVSTEFSGAGFGSTDIISNSFDKLLIVILIFFTAILLALLVKF